MFSRSQLWSLLSKQRTAVCSQRRFIHQTLLKSGASTPATTANDGGQHHGNDGHGEPERHVRLTPKFYRIMGVFWAMCFGFAAQHNYFTRPDEDGNPRLHPITRWILYYRQSEADKAEFYRRMLIESRQDGEVNIFHQTEIQRPVKDPRFDGRMLRQKEWAYAPRASDTDYVDMSDVKWRKGYGEDEDSLEVLAAKPELRANNN